MVFLAVLLTHPANNDKENVRYEKSSRQKVEVANNMGIVLGHIKKSRQKDSASEDK